jgi:hypothetical protein
VIDTWSEAHSPRERMSEDDADEIWEWMQAQPPVPLTLKEARANARHQQA